MVNLGMLVLTHSHVSSALKKDTSHTSPHLKKEPDTGLPAHLAAAGTTGSRLGAQPVFALLSDVAPRPRRRGLAPTEGASASVRAQWRPL